MKYAAHTIFTLIVGVAISVPVWAQQAVLPPAPLPTPLPATSSPIQKLIAVDQLVEQKQYDEAVRGYNSLLSDDPHNPQLLNRLGIVYQAQQNLRQAKIYYDRALKADPHFAAATNNLGSVYYNQKNYRKAVRLYLKAIKLEPNTAAYHSNLGYALLEQKKYKEMMDSFRQAAALDPSIFDQHNRSGVMMLERATEDNAALHFYLAQTFGEMGNVARCLEYLKKARDEHYKRILSIKTDPAFAPVRSDPAFQEFIDALTRKTAPNPS